MAYDAAQQKLREYRSGHLSGLMDEKPVKWFTSLWGSISGMLATFDSTSENGEISANYAKGKHKEKIPAHIKLDYVCAYRREVRKQYVSGDDGVYTDVTPFRHGMISANGAMLFASSLDNVLKQTKA